MNRRKTASYPVTAGRPSSQTILTASMEQHAWDVGIKLEYVNGLPVWEGSAVLRHQKKIDAIRGGIVNAIDAASACECISVADLTILFRDGSIKRPDISIFCREPSELDTNCMAIPSVVIEIISKGYEKKDTEISLPFYLSQGIPDVVLFDPATNIVSHYHGGRSEAHSSPVELTFVCGCRATV